MNFVQAAAQQPSSLSACTSSNFAALEVAGLQLNQIEANVVRGASQTLPTGLYLGHGGAQFTGLDFCNVSITYSHTGRTEPINVHTYLPARTDWNGRMMGVGGGGWSGGLFAFLLGTMEAGVNDGYVTVGTDGGHDAVNPDPGKWALKDDGEVNIYLLETFFFTCLSDMAEIGKAVTKQFYGTSPTRTYFNGCSQGGRQGLAIAQRYPEAYDGILANAPAIHFVEALPQMMWPQFIMDEMKTYPPLCEFAAIRAAAIRECDLDDGVADGLLSDPQACKFDAQEVVGQPVDCPGGSPSHISEGAAKVANAAWAGPSTTSGQHLWYEIAHDADLAGMFALANVLCKENSTDCHGAPFEPARAWMQYFVAKQRDFDHTGITRAQFEKMFEQSVSEWQESIGTTDPNLSKFRNAGGKMITMHGISDQVIPVEGSQHYYDNVLKLDPNAADYYRYFEAPGVAHCFGGPGHFPTTLFDDLVAWVEEGRAPNNITAKSIPDSQGKVHERPICAYPLVARYDGTGDIKNPNNYQCAEEHLSATPIEIFIQRSKKFLLGDDKAEKTSGNGEL